MFTRMIQGDVETQRNGVVALIYMMGRPMTAMTSYTISERFRYPNLMLSLPFKFESTHICYDAPIWRTMIHLTKLVTDEYTRLRIREHCCELSMVDAQF